MPSYVYCKERGMMVEKDNPTCPMLSDAERAKPLQVPQVFGDLDGYQSPVDGAWIDGRRARRYDLEKNNCVDGNEVSAPKKLKNERFIKKHGLEKLAAT